MSYTSNLSTNAAGEIQEQILYNGEPLDIRSGDVVLYRTELVWYEPITWLSFLIRVFTGLEYNHSALVVSSWGVLMLNEALAGGVIQRRLSDHLARNRSEILILRPKDAIEEAAFCRRANAYLGTPYDFASLVIYQPIYRIWLKLTGRQLWIGPTGIKAEGSEVCSEYVATVYKLPEAWLASSAELYANPFFNVHFVQPI